MPKWDAWNGKSTVFTSCLLQFKRLGWSQTDWWNMDAPMVPKSHKCRAHGFVFIIVLMFWQDVFFYEFVAPLKVCQESQLSATLAANGCRDGTLGRGRRERWCAGEEKEEELCCRRSKNLPENIQLRVQHAAPKVAADLCATASSAELPPKEHCYNSQKILIVS